MGDIEWAESCRVAVRKHVTVTRNVPEPGALKLAGHRPSQVPPSQVKYWKQRGDKTPEIGHVLEYIYGYYDPLRHAKDDSLAAELDTMAYQIF